MYRVKKTFIGREVFGSMGGGGKKLMGSWD